MSGPSLPLSRPARILILAQNPVSHAPHDVLSEACASGRRMAKWLSSSGLADELRYELAFENAWPEPGKCPAVTKMDPSHVWETVVEFEPDLVLCCGKVALQFCQLFLPTENYLDWYHPSGLNRQLNKVKDDYWTGVALGHEVEAKLETFYDNPDNASVRSMGREQFRLALGVADAGTGDLE